jgi:bacterioferritin
MDHFVSDLKKTRAQARMHMEAGAVTEAYTADRKQVLAVLNDILASEIVVSCVTNATFSWRAGLTLSPSRPNFSSMPTKSSNMRTCGLVAERIVQLERRTQFQPGRACGAQPLRNTRKEPVCSR